MIDEHRFDGRWPGAVASHGGSVPVALWILSGESPLSAPGVFPAQRVDPFLSVSSEALRLLWLLRHMGVMI